MFWVSKVEEILKNCNEKIKSNHINLAIWSFWNNFEGIQKGISFDFEKGDVDKFIEICDNRLDRSKTFLSDIAIVFGFDLTALSIIAVTVKFGAPDPILSLLNNTEYGILFRLLVAFLILNLIFLLILLLHYRSHVHAWTALKEKAILIKPEKELNSEKKKEG